MHMMMFVLEDPSKLDQVLEAWRALGVDRVNVIESAGVRRCESQRVCGRYLAGLRGLVESTEQCQYTLLAVVADVRAVRMCLDALEKAVGDLGDANTGFLAAWELALVRGVPDQVAEPGLTDGLA